MLLSKLLPKRYSIRLILMMFFLGLVPFIIFGFLMNTFDRRFRSEMDRSIQLGQEEEDRRSLGMLTQMAENAVRQKALDVAFQVELYVTAHPGMSSVQFQEDSEFRNIAVQPVFQSGYTAVYNGDNAIALIHKNPAIENVRLSTLADTLVEFWTIIEGSLGGKYSHGYYQWKDPDGEVRTKFMYIAPVASFPADNVPMMVAATAYVEEFTRPIRISRDVSYGTSQFLAMTFKRLMASSKQVGFLFLGIGLFFNLILAFWAGTFFSKTIIQLSKATRSVIKGHLDVQVSSNMTGDVGELTEGFNRMVSHLAATTVRKEELEAHQEELHQVNTKLKLEVTDRKQAETALRESEERLQAILAMNPNPIVVYSKEGFPEYLNKAFRENFGWSLEELKGRPIPFVPHDLKQESSEKLSNVYRTGNIVRFESQRLNRQGQLSDVLLCAAPFMGPNKEPIGMVVNYSDITEIKRLKSQLHHSQKMEAIGTLAGGIAHNFNNVLMGISGLVSLMLLNKKDSDPDYKHLKNMEEYSQNAAELTKDLLAFARGGKYEVQATDINQIIRHETNMFGRTKKELCIQETYDENLWAVEVDRGQVRQMLMNLYVNAWQAMPDGGDLVIRTQNCGIDEVNETPFEMEPGRYIKISITDNGVGMGEDIVEKIFEPFFTTREAGLGTGLGLASVYGIIKSHRGYIDVSSVIGKGTTFSIYLPASEKSVAKEKTLNHAILEGKETVLLVDDEKMIIDVGQQMLEALGYNVVSALNGKEAIDKYHEKKDQIGIVVLDMIMPGMGAKEVYLRLKEINPKVKVLLSSGYSMSGRAEEIMSLGCNGFIQKPFLIEMLSQKLRHILDED